MHVAKIGHVEFRTTGLGRMLDYYTKVMGLGLTERAEDGTAYLTSGPDHHDLVLRAGSENRIDHVAYQLGDSTSLQEAADELRRKKVEVEEIGEAGPGIGEAIRFQDPEGNVVELYSAIEPSGGTAPGSGIAPTKLGHLAMLVRDPQKVADFYQEVLGFRWSDWLEDFFVFLRCNADHHSANFLKSPEGGRMHHFAYELRDWSHVQLACDRLAEEDVSVIWGPGRHGPGHNIFTYHRDPDSNIVELFTQLDLVLDEELGSFDPRPWHEDSPQRPKVWKAGPKAPNSWGQGPPEGFMG